MNQAGVVAIAICVSLALFMIVAIIVQRRKHHHVLGSTVARKDQTKRFLPRKTVDGDWTD